MREVKICENCNRENEVDALECGNPECGADLTYVISEFVDDREEFNTPPIKKTGTIVLVPMKLIGVRDGKQIEIPFTGGTIGREGDIDGDYFELNPYVSSFHAKLYYEGVDLILLDENSTNGTKLNGMPIEKGAGVRITIGDKITFANLEFLVTY